MNRDAFMTAVNRNFQFRAFWLGMGWILIGLVFYLSLAANPPDTFDIIYADKVKHLLAYSVLTGWFCQLYKSAKHQVMWTVGLFLMGVSLEILQGLGGYRFFEYADMAANTAGVFLGWWLSRGWCAGWLFRADQALSRQ